MICPNAPRRAAPRSARGRNGQSLVESCLALLLLCLIFAGFLQVSRLLAAREILAHAAARGARAKTVGFNRWMVEKSVRVAAIPNAGRLIEPEFENVDLPLRLAVARLSAGELWSAVLRWRPASEQFHVERARIPEFMASPTRSRAAQTLDYADWRTVRFTVAETPSANEMSFDPLVHVTVSQAFPLTNSLSVHRAFTASDVADLSAESSIEKHYALYLDDMHW